MPRIATLWKKTKKRNLKKRERKRGEKQGRSESSKGRSAGRGGKRTRTQGVEIRTCLKKKNRRKKSILLKGM